MTVNIIMMDILNGTDVIKNAVPEDEKKIVFDYLIY